MQQPNRTLLTKMVLSQFDRNENIARQSYIDFFQAQRDEGYRKEFHTGVYESRILGDDHFSEQVFLLAEEQWRYRWSYDQLITSLCSVYKIENSTLIEPGKRQPAAQARAVASFLVQENNYTSLTDLGKIFGRDLTALSKSAGRIRDRLKRDAELQGKIKRIKMLLGRMPKCQA